MSYHSQFERCDSKASEKSESNLQEIYEGQSVGTPRLYLPLVSQMTGSWTGMGQGKRATYKLPVYTQISFSSHEKKDKEANSSLILINFIVTSLWHFKMKSIFLLFINGKFLKCGISLSSAHLTGHISSVQAAHLVGATTQIKPGGWRLHPMDWGTNPGFTLLQKLRQ